MFRAFDFPVSDTTSVQRFTTTVPQQALFMLNNRMVEACAKQLIERPDVQTLPWREKIETMYTLLYGRQPESDELLLAERFLDSHNSENAWQRLAQGLLMANEFMFVD